jgi:chromosome segregation ATPase
MTVDRLELTGGAKKWLVDEMFVAPYAATEEEIKSWYEAKGPFVDQEEINYQQKQIVQLADEISSKVSRDDFDALENTVTIMGTVVTQTAEAVEQKAELSTVTELGDNLSQVTNEVGTLTTSYNSISARVESIEGDIDTLTGDVSEVKTRTGNLEVRAGNIEASVSSLEEDIDEHGNRLASVENAVVNVLPGQIALKANASEVYKKEEIDTKLGQKADSATVSELTTRITSAEQTIDAHTGIIAQKAERSEVYTKTETDAKLGTKVDTTTYKQSRRT